MGAFAEARYFGWQNIEPDQKFPVKGHSLSADEILGSADWARPFAGGPVLLVRLAPVDYHHMHYPDDGTTRDHQRLGRRLWTVNWHALQATIASARAFLYAASIMPISRRIARQYEFETDSKKEPRRSGANNKRGQVQRGMQRGQHLTRSG